MRSDGIEMNGILALKTGANIASAATTDLATATGNSVTITGTTTITALGTVQSGAVFTLTFAGILILTHNGTSLILPTGANITTAAGDVMQVVSLGSGNWKCLSYQRGDGSALVASGPYTADADNNLFFQGSTATLGTGCTSNTFEQGATGNALGDNGSNNIFQQAAAGNTAGTGCTSNTFEQGATSNVLGNDCTSNTFGQAAANNTLGASCGVNVFKAGAQDNELGATCAFNTFGQGVNGFIFGDNLGYTTIAPSVTGADYTASPDYDFLYSTGYPSQIFFNSGVNFHSYVDPATNRIVLTNLTTLAVTYIGEPGIINILREDFIALAGTYSTTSLYRITDATPGAILLDPAANNANTPDFTFSVVTNETALLQGTYYLGTTGTADDVFTPSISQIRFEVSDTEIDAGAAINITELPEVVGYFWAITNAAIQYTGTTPYTNIMYVGIISKDPQYDDAGRLVTGTDSFGGMADIRSDTGGGNGDCYAAGRCQVTFSGTGGGGGDGVAVLFLTAQLVKIAA